MKIELKKFLPIFLKKIRFLLLIITALGIVMDIFSNRHTSDIIIFTLIAVWLGTIFGWNLEANFSLFGALVFLIIGQIAVIFQKIPVDYYSPAEKAALWIYVFFVIGVIKKISELKKPSAPKVIFLDVVRLFLGRQEREKSLSFVREWYWNKQAKIKEGFMILVGKRENKEYLGLVKKLSVDSRHRIIKMAVFSIGVLKLRIKEIFNLAKSSINFVFIIMKFGIKRSFILLKDLIKILFVKLRKFVIVSSILLWRFFVKEIGQVFDFSSSPVLKIVKGKFLIIKKTRYFQILFFILIDLPILHLVLIFFILRKLIAEIKFYNFFFEKMYLKQLLLRVVPATGVLWLVVALAAGVFFVLEPKINKAILGLDIKRRTPRLLLNIILFWFGLGLIGKEKTDFSNLPLKSFQPKHGRWFYLTFFLLILFLGDKWIFFKARDKFEFRPYITGVYYDIASRYSEVSIFGHNFRNLPFKGKVNINNMEQKIVEWSDEKIIIETDPIMSNSGDLVIVNDYGFGKEVESNFFKFTYFDSQGSSPDDEKKFWKTLKEKALKSSFE